MSKVSVVIASRNEQYTQRTIDDLFEKASGQIEVIVVLDGWWPDPPLKNRENQVIIHNSESQGLRPAINAGARIATGEYLMKCDAHCMFAPGFDETLKKDCARDWVVIPRRCSLNPEEWRINEHRPIVDYEYVSYPFRDIDASVRQSNVWKERAIARKDIAIDETMSMQGSCWFMRREYFNSTIGPLQVEGYGTFILEPEEIAFKCWTSGGQVMINKNTWYAHFHKGPANGRGYFIDRRGLRRGRRFHVQFWWENKWPKQMRTYESMIRQFAPIPGWPEDLDSLFKKSFEDLAPKCVV
jgi:glycosyltransferase involved in cell wall biosynthesis